MARKYAQEPAARLKFKYNCLNYLSAGILNALENRESELILVEFNSNKSSDDALYDEAILLERKEDRYSSLLNIRDEEDHLKLGDLNDEERLERAIELENEIQLKVKNGEFEILNLNDLEFIDNDLKQVLDDRKDAAFNLCKGGVSSDFIEHKIQFYFLKNSHKIILNKEQIDYLASEILAKERFSKNDLDEIYLKVKELNTNFKLPRKYLSVCAIGVRRDVYDKKNFSEEIDQLIQKKILEEGSNQIEVDDFYSSLLLIENVQFKKNELERRIKRIRKEIGIAEESYSREQYHFLNKIVKNYSKKKGQIQFSRECKKFNDIKGKKSRTKNFRAN